MFRTYFLLVIATIQAMVGINAWKGLPSASQYAGISTPVEELSYSAPSDPESVDYQKKIADMGITLHPGTDFTADSKPTKAGMEHCASLVYGTLKKMPGGVTSNLKDLTFYFTNNGRRGLGGGSTIILRCQNVSDEELVGVLVHELGHIMDTGVLKGNFWSGESEFHDGKNAIYNDDPSLDFYRISFKDEKSMKTTDTNLDFVTGYAKTDPFEDFAETYNYYLLHGKEFKDMAAHNVALSEKYDFMKEKVFSGQEFDYQSVQKNASFASRVYDSTTVAYDLKKFLAI